MSDFDVTSVTRGLANALVFCTGSKLAQVELRVTGNTLTITGTNNYTAGREFIPSLGVDDTHCWLSVSSGKELLEALKPHNGTRAPISITPDGVTHPAGFTPSTAVLRPATWVMLDELWGQIEDRPVNLPENIMFNPDYLRWLAQVTANPKNAAADFYFSGPDDPALVKVGSTFEALIMPVKREIQADVHGPDVLW